MKPRLLDLFCGAGGAARGYQQAGFHVTGVDIVSQPHYCGDEFYQADAMTYPLDSFDAIHASPPCQGYSIMRNLPWLKGKDYPKLIIPIQGRLAKTGKPWVIENVMGAKLDAQWLCGQMFDLPFYRHRYFWTSFFWLQPSDPPHKHTIKPGRNFGDHGHMVFQEVRAINKKMQKGYPRITAKGLERWQNGAQKRGCGYGHAAGIALIREAMQIDWMTRDEITQAIPPVYTEFIGGLLMKILDPSLEDAVEALR